jgi:dTDP-4-dehydrorhamnose 3,5-epimerase
MSKEIRIIKGGIHQDSRGTIGFVNDFDLSPCVRFYRISHPEISIIRAWQGHKKESKWFHCIRGSFILNVIKIDDWEIPSKHLEVQKFELKNSESLVLFVPPGHVTGFKALEIESRLLVFSDFNTEESKLDDYRFEKNYWFNWD